MPNDPRSLSEFRARATAAIRDRSKKLSSLFKLSKSILYAGMAGVAGVAQFVTAGDTILPSAWVGIGATVIIFVYAVANIRIEPEVVAQLGLAHEAIDEAQKAREEADDARQAISSYQRMFDRMIEVFNSTRGMRGLIQQMCVTEGSTEEEVVSTIMLSVGRSVSIGAGFALDDEWTICVYRAVPAPGGHKELRLVEHHRAIQCTKDDARVWREGQGVAGVSFAKADEVIIDDLWSESVRSLTLLKAHESRISNGRYRSMVCVPIFVADTPEPWGVVCGTNDEVNHFNHRPETGLKNDEAIRTLASHLGLAISVVRCRNKRTAAPPRPPKPKKTGTKRTGAPAKGRGDAVKVA